MAGLNWVMYTEEINRSHVAVGVFNRDSHYLRAKNFKRKAWLWAFPFFTGPYLAVDWLINHVITTRAKRIQVEEQIKQNGFDEAFEEAKGIVKNLPNPHRDSTGAVNSPSSHLPWR